MHIRPDIRRFLPGPIMCGSGLLDNLEYVLYGKRIARSQQLQIVVDVITSTADAPLNKCGLVQDVEDGSD